MSHLQAGGTSRMKQGSAIKDEEFRILVEAVSDYAIFRLDADGHVVTWNTGARSIKGYEEREILGRHFSVFYTEEDQKAGMPGKVLDMATRRGSWTDEGWRIRKDGSRFWAHVTVTALFEEDTLHGFVKVTRDMTEPHQREVQLRHSEERYRHLFEQALEGIAITCVDGKILDVNPAAEELLGYSHEELVQMTAQEIWANPEERQQRIPQIAEAGGIRNAVVRARRKDGEEILLEVSGTARYGADGEVLGFQGHFRDITQREHAEVALRESEAKFRQLSENAQIGIALIQDGVYQYVNPALAQMSGYEREELIGESPAKLFQPSDRPFVRERVRKHLSGELQSATREMSIRTKHGEMRTFEMMGTHVTLQGKRTLIGTMHDVTERKRAEEALGESEAMFRALAEESLVGIAIVQDNRFKYVNERFAEIYGYEREELIDTFPGDELVHPDDRELQREKMRQRIEGEVDAVRFQMRVLTKDGRTRRVEVHGRRFTYQGRPAVIGSVLDVTDRIRLQSEVLSMQEEERQRLGRDLHDGVASQLTTIGLMIDLVSRRVSNGKIGIDELPDHMKEIQDRVMKSGEDVRRLSRGLALSGLSAKDLPAALERLSQDIEGAHFKNELGHAWCDDAIALHLYRVAQEAATNARKYAEADRVTIRLGGGEHGLILEIEDDGCGFDQAAVKEGSLGLRTMRYRAELLGGTLSIDTAPGRGTRIRCRVPASSRSL